MVYILNLLLYVFVIINKLIHLINIFLFKNKYGFKSSFYSTNNKLTNY